MFSLLLTGMIILMAIAFATGVKKVKSGHSYQKVPRFLYLLSIFVWGDSLVIAPFYILSSVVSLLLNDFHLFLLLIASFHLFRSIGETLYWFLVQFDHTGKREKPEDHILFKITGNSSVFFLHQVINQIQSTILFVIVVYLIKTWNI